MLAQKTIPEDNDAQGHIRKPCQPYLARRRRRGRDHGLRGVSRQPPDFSLIEIDTLSDDTRFDYVVPICFACAVGLMGFVLRSPFGRTIVAVLLIRRDDLLALPRASAA